MKSRIIWIVAGVLLVSVVVWLIFSGKGLSVSEPILKSPEVGIFELSVTVSGELDAKNSLDIKGPGSVRKVGIWQLKITDLVPEGTVVKKGDFVAELDKSELMSKVKEVEINLQKLASQQTQARLDCTLTLSQARDNLVNLKYGMEQRKLEMEESIYEAPSARRQVEIEFEKSKRALEQEIVNYTTKVHQAEAKMMEVTADLDKEQQKMDEFVALLAEFTISAPENGMVIYAREWGGEKLVVGSTVGAWDPTVATLPDLSVMESITYVNEVDIQKISKGLKVDIGLDADPKKKLKGEVTSVANIGEQLPNMDSKVFEVRILVLDTDSTLRPAMTTSNKIVMAVKPDVLSIPLDCIHNQDSVSFVYLREGTAIVKQEVKIGLTNDNNAEILEGILPEDKMFLSLPDENAVKSEMRPSAGRKR